MPAAPALFIGHGSPMNAIEDTPSARGWRDVAARFPKPRAVLCISAHWVTDGVKVGASAKPPTIHDFGGFPQTLRDVQYPAPGDPQLAARIINALEKFEAREDAHRGLDHGVWSVLKWMYPDADVPALQLSLDRRRSPADHFAIGHSLAPLRDDNVLIVSSGNVVHNLRAFFGNVPTPWAKTFDDFIIERVEAAHDAAVLDYWEHPDAENAAPDWEHFWPLFATLGARDATEAPYLFNRHLENGISMTSFAYGLPQ